MDMKFKTTKEYKKIKRNFIFLNLCFGFCYFLIFICSGFCIDFIIFSLNVGDIIYILISFFCLIASVSFLSLLIIGHIIQVKEFRFLLFFNFHLFWFLHWFYNFFFKCRRYYLYFNFLFLFNSFCFLFIIIDYRSYNTS
ncbi:hypothetical protein C6B38_08375 [Spiroplasma sp. ChiS]|nr:hypothetical protein C6B38_08375 [Spiroplasma sp. ChiS]